MREFFRGFIPRTISPKLIITFFECLRGIQRMSCCKYADHFAQNMCAYTNHNEAIDCCDGYIENQREYCDMQYGVSQLSLVGCEVIAVYNALKDLEKQDCSLVELIDSFEKDGMVLSGRFGTSPKAIADYFNATGYHTRISAKTCEFETIAATADTLIFTFYNDRDDIFEQIHTVHVSKHNDTYIAHNVYGDGRVVGPFASLDDLMIAINAGRIKPICLIGIMRE